MKNKIFYFFVVLLMLISITSCKKSTVTITMITFDGTKVIYHVAYEGDSIKKLPTPTKSGYEFGGWYYDYNFENKVEYPFTAKKDITLYAGWYNHLEYELDEATDSYTVIGVNYPVFDIVIPSEFKGKPVTKIAENAFEASYIIKTIEIPNTIKIIENFAFSNCVNLTTINLPDEIEEIGTDIFSGCEKLNYQTDRGLRYIDNWLVNGTYVEVKDLVVSDNTIGIFPGAFKNNKNINSIVISNKVKKIYEDTFAESTLTSVTIGESVNYIDKTAFSFMKALCEINVNENNQYFKSISNVLFNKDVTELILYPSAKDTKEYTMPNTVRIVKDNACMYNEFIQELKLSSDLVELGKQAFFSCSSLKSIIFNNCLEKIGNEAFRLSSNIEKIILPTTVTEIGEGAFANISKIKELSVPFVYNNGINYSINYLFLDKIPSSLETINILGGDQIKKDSLLGINNVKNIYISSSIMKIEEGSFVDGNSIESIIVDKNNEYYKSISDIIYSIDGKQLVYYSAKKTNETLVLNETVEVIFKYAIKDNDSLKKIELNNGLKEIHFNAFCNLPNLEMLIIPSSVVYTEQDICCNTNNVKIYIYSNINLDNWSEGWNTYNYPVVWDALFPTINVNELEFHLDINETYTLVYTVNDAPNEYNVIISVIDDSVIRYEDGIITALKDGVTHIKLIVEGYPTSELLIFVHVGNGY